MFYSDSFPQGRSTVQEGIFPELLVNKIERTGLLWKSEFVGLGWDPRFAFSIMPVGVSEKCPID